MIRRIVDFVFVLLFVWACMILGLWVIDAVIVPFELPGISSGIITATIKVAVSAAMVLVWLWLWREIIRRMFWHVLRTQRSLTDESRNQKLGENAKIRQIVHQRDEP